ncbi:MAG: hypothetical protein NZM11_02670 [Anaerolineales bacterium]|nr:hypothetical protein [Anaerolineales bacterium]
MAYPDYVHRLLATAREEGQGYADQYAAAICSDVLALFPDCEEKWTSANACSPRFVENP